MKTPKKCSKDGCNQYAWSKGLCKGHRQAENNQPALSRSKPIRRSSSSKIRHRTTKNQEQKQNELTAMQQHWQDSLKLMPDGNECCICECTGKHLHQFEPYHMAHVISKGQLPAARADLNNFVIVSRETHNAMDGQNSSGQCRSDLPADFLAVLDAKSQYIRNKYC